MHEILQCSHVARCSTHSAHEVIPNRILLNTSIAIASQVGLRSILVVMLLLLLLLLLILVLQLLLLLLLLMVMMMIHRT